MKKVFSVILAIVMIATLSAAAFADDTQEITISYTAAESYVVTIPSSQSFSADSLSKTGTVSATALLEAGKVLKVFMNSANDFALTCGASSIAYTVSKDGNAIENNACVLAVVAGSTSGSSALNFTTTEEAIAAATVAGEHIDIVTLKVFCTGRELLEYVKQNGGFDIYILDVVMPDMNGMELASTLRLMKDDGKIIFTTASLDYAVASYDVQAFYYMVKPVDPNKLFRILDNAIAELKPHETVTTVRTKDGDISLRMKDITYVEVVDRALLYHLSDGRFFKSLALRNSFRETVSDLAADTQFAVCGASKLVNLRYVDAIDSETILLKDGTVIYPPRSAYADLRRQWRDFMR